MKPAFLQGPFKVRGAWQVRATVTLLRIYALGYALGSRSVCALCTVALIFSVRFGCVLYPLSPKGVLFSLDA